MEPISNNKFDLRNATFGGRQTNKTKQNEIKKTVLFYIIRLKIVIVFNLSRRLIYNRIIIIIIIFLIKKTIKIDSPMIAVKES